MRKHKFLIIPVTALCVVGVLVCAYLLMPDIMRYFNQESKPGTSFTKGSDIMSKYFHIHKVNPDIPLKDIINNKNITDEENFNIYVDLSTRTLFMKYKQDVLKEYRIAAGAMTDEGDKVKEGDRRTPRGEFYVCTKLNFQQWNGNLGTRAILISYPSLEDAERGLKDNIITQSVFNQIKTAAMNKSTPPQTTPLGSAIEIHGGARPEMDRDWTAGCIGMYNEDVEEIYDYVNIGTSVVIK